MWLSANLVFYFSKNICTKKSQKSTSELQNLLLNKKMARKIYADLRCNYISVPLKTGCCIKQSQNCNICV